MTELDDFAGAVSKLRDSAFFEAHILTGVSYVIDPVLHCRFHY